MYQVGQTFLTGKVHLTQRVGDREVEIFPARPAELAWCIHFDLEFKLQLFFLVDDTLSLNKHCSFNKNVECMVLGLTSLIQ